MAGRLSVAVVQGGASTEAEVSRASGKSVAAALEEAGHGVVRLELDPSLAEAIRTGRFDVVFPVAHGAVGEDGSLQGLLEVLGVPYVGSGVLASALAMDKGMARRIFALDGLPVAAALVAPRPPPADASSFHAHARAAVERARGEVGPRLVVKPSAQGSALGVARFEGEASVEDVADALVSAWQIDDVVLLEHFARGREITCGVLDVLPASAARPLPPTEIISPSDAFYTFEARYAPGRSLHTCPAPIGERLTTLIQTIAVAAHRALGCRDLSRVDLILGDGEAADVVTLLEVNTMPGFTATSLYPEAAARAGIPLAALAEALVWRAYVRGPAPRNGAHPLPG
jgi:D-alanine-D-alanine ligase